MNSETLRNYKWWLADCGPGAHQKAHTLRCGAFSAYLFQIIGNKHIVLAAIQHPICSAAQPADAIPRFMRAWEDEKNSDEYKMRKEVSERATDERKALKVRAHAARQALVKGSRIHAAIWRGTMRPDTLSHEEATLLLDFTSGRLAQVRDECDAAFGWNRQKRIAAGSAAISTGR